jgi:recombinase
MLDGRCARCWATKTLVNHEIEANPRADPTVRTEKVILCKHCAENAPGDALLFWDVYMRFGSTREMLQHYHSENEEEALRKLCMERGLNEREVLRRARGLASAEALNAAVRKTNSFLAYASPYGYDYVNGSLQVKSEEARVVTIIFRRYLEGKGIAKICQELNREGFRTKTGRAWASQTIANILSNPVYCGLTRVSGDVKRGRHEALIEVATFNRVQTEMQRRIRRPDQRKAETPQLRLEDYVA